MLACNLFLHVVKNETRLFFLTKRLIVVLHRALSQTYFAYANFGVELSLRHTRDNGNMNKRGGGVMFNRTTKITCMYFNSRHIVLRYVITSCTLQVNSNLQKKLTTRQQRDLPIRSYRRLESRGMYVIPVSSAVKTFNITVYTLHSLKERPSTVQFSTEVRPISAF